MTIHDQDAPKEISTGRNARAPTIFIIDNSVIVLFSRSSWFESMPGSHLLQSTTYKTMVQSLYEFCTDASKPVRSNSLTLL